jgi:penicillin amidase
MGYTVPGHLHEAGLHGAGFDMVGLTPTGFPVLLFGQNGDVAWTSTSGVGNGLDVFVLELAGDDYHYWYNGQIEAMESRTEMIEVRDADPVAYDVYQSVYGPVTDWEDGFAYTQKRAWEGQALQSWAAWVDATRALSFDGYRQAASSVALSINWGYADAEGTIGYIHCGRYPILHPDVDVRLPTPGTGEYDWSGYQAPDWNPWCLNPEQGYLANMNNRPAAGYPIGDASLGAWGSYHRAGKLFGFLERESGHTLGTMKETNRLLGLSDQDGAALIPLFVSWMGDQPDPRIQEAVGRLESWDKLLADDNGDGRYDDPAASIWAAWLAGALEGVLGDELAQYASESKATVNLLLHVLEGEDSPVPLGWDFLNGQEPGEALADALTLALSTLEAAFGTPDMDAWLTWTEKHVFGTTNHAGIPMAAIPVRDLHVYMIRGSGNHIVALDPARARAVSVNPPGQSGFIAPDGTPSGHYEDQLDLYEDYAGYKPMVIPEPISGLAALAETPVTVGEPVTLTAQILAGVPATYTWAFGDGDAASGPVVTHAYSAEGAYTATVTASNLFGGETATTTVRVGPFQVWLPLVIRSNCDG